ncbi:MAG: FemAB family PEP-CTERM system-associated protein [Gammaproteobacteria bacterium]|nr:FemAB family PEP-CTERM system-associated protein [Gammaproteobacteria bacterium]
MIDAETCIIKYLKNKEDVRIDEYVSKSDRASVYHLTAWCKLINDVFTHDSYYIYAESEDNEIVGALPLVHIKSRIFGNYIVSMPYFNYGGAIGNCESIENKMMQAAINLASQLNVEHIEFRDTDDRCDLFPVRNDKVNMILELPDSPELLGKMIGAKKRSQIKRPQKEGVKSIVGGVELLDDFYFVFSVNMRDLGTPVYSKRFFLEIMKMFPDQTNIVILKLKEKPISAAFLIGHKEQLEIPWASTIKEYNKFSPNMFLYWEVLKMAIEKGYKKFDFGRSTINSGTYRFKKQWGAIPKQLYWHYWLAEGEDIPQLTPGNSKYRLAIKVWQNLPTLITNFIGPSIIKNLP